MLWDCLHHAKSEKKSLTTVWLDIANAYGSIPHALIFLALNCYGFQPAGGEKGVNKMTEIILNNMTSRSKIFMKDRRYLVGRAISYYQPFSGK